MTQQTCEPEIEVERAYQRYCHLLELWSRENAIKTQKLQYFLLTTALLIIGYALTPDKPAGQAGQPLICLVGAALSLIWTLSLGRTMRFQKKWQALLAELSAEYSADERFQILKKAPSQTKLPLIVRLAGSVSSKYYLIGAPLGGIVFWVWAYNSILYPF